MKKFICAALVLAASSANAWIADGQKFLDYFNEPFKNGYVAAIADNQLISCIPPGTIHPELTRVAVDYIRSLKPFQRKLAASWLVKEALMKKYNCHTYVYPDDEKPKTESDPMTFLEAHSRPVSGNPNINKQKQ